VDWQIHWLLQQAINLETAVRQESRGTIQPPQMPMGPARQLDRGYEALRKKPGSPSNGCGEAEANQVMTGIINVEAPLQRA
jgi:hypothetical protein